MLISKLLFFVFFVCCYAYNYVDREELPELEYLNRSVDPCDDFYEYACGNFKNVKPRPEQYPFWDNFIILQTELHELMQLILDTSLEDTTKKARAAYRSCLETDYSDNLNVPELQVLEDAGGWPLISKPHYHSTDFSWNAIGDLIATHGVPLFFSIEVTQNLYNADEYIIYLGRDRVLLPSIHPPIIDNSEDFLNHGVLKRNKHPFEIFLTKIALHLRNQVGSFKKEETIEKESGDILEFMKVVQQGGIKNDEYNTTTFTTTVEELQEWVDNAVGTEINLNWLEYLNHVFNRSGVTVKPTTKVTVTDPSVFYGVLNLITQTSKDMLKNFAMTRIFTFTATDSNTVIREAYDEFRRNMGDMVSSRNEYCIRKILDYPSGIGFSMALTHEYQRYHFNKNKINNAIDMINDLTTTFTEMLTESDWLDEETKVNALIKDAALITLLAYPDFVEDENLVDKYYENLRTCTWDHFGNSQRLRSFRQASNLALLDKARSREVWQISPLITNAYYNSQNNRILFPISMLNPPFFTGSVSSVDYGRIGTIIGHEITHGFDNQGMLYDENGTFSFWWSAQTFAEFEVRKRCFLDQYSKYYLPEIDQYVNAESTLRENIADNGGVREAFRAFKKLKQRATLLHTEEFTPEQLFFVGYATMWCTQQTDDYLLNKIQNSGHAPARYRVIGSLSNNEDFSKAFNCPVGSKMNPKDKCVLW